MWNFRIGCFFSMCGIVWAASLLTPQYGLRDSLAFLPLLAVFGAVQTMVIMRYVNTAGAQFEKLWVGCLCGAINAVLALAIFFGGMALEPVLKGELRKIVTLAALILPFVLPPVLSPRIVALLVTRKHDQSKGITRENA